MFLSFDSHKWNVFSSKEFCMEGFSTKEFWVKPSSKFASHVIPFFSRMKSEAPPLKFSSISWFDNTHSKLLSEIFQCFAIVATVRTMDLFIEMTIWAHFVDELSVLVVNVVAMSRRVAKTRQMSPIFPRQSKSGDIISQYRRQSRVVACSVDQLVTVMNHVRHPTNRTNFFCS